MTTPSISRATAGPPRKPPSLAARLRSAQAGHAPTNRGHGRAPRARAPSPLRRAAGGAQPARLDDLPLDGKTPPLPQAAQALYNVVVAQLFGGAAIVADHELAFVRMLDIATGDERARGLDLVDQLVRQQEFERTVDGRRTQLAAPAPQPGEQGVSSRRLIR